MRAILAMPAVALAACTTSAPSTNTAVTPTSASRAGGGVPFTATACASTPAEARAQVAQLEQEWETAFYRRDSAFFQRTLADDYVLAGGATAGGKRDYIADLTRHAAAPVNVTGSPPPMEDIRAFGDVVVVSGVWTNKAAPSERAAYTELFVCREGQWKAVHGHYNMLAPAGR